jgi:hypothetical protein
VFTNKVLQNLGLGVLEEKPDGIDHHDSEKEDEDDAVDSDTEHSGASGKKKEQDILGNLMGRKRGKPVSIEEVEDD